MLRLSFIKLPWGACRAHSRLLLLVTNQMRQAPSTCSSLLAPSVPGGSFTRPHRVVTARTVAIPSTSPTRSILHRHMQYRNLLERCTAQSGHRRMDWRPYPFAISTCSAQGNAPIRSTLRCFRDSSPRSYRIGPLRFTVTENRLAISHTSRMWCARIFWPQSRPTPPVAFSTSLGAARVPSMRCCGPFLSRLVPGYHRGSCPRGLETSGIAGPIPQLLGTRSSGLHYPSGMRRSRRRSSGLDTTLALGLHSDTRASTVAPASDRHVSVGQHWEIHLNRRCSLAGDDARFPRTVRPMLGERGTTVEGPAHPHLT